MVLEKFVSLIKSNKIDQLNVDKLPYKAVGWVGDKFHKQKISIQRYFPTFNKSLKKDNGTFDNLKAYCKKLEKSKFSHLITHFFAALVHFLYLARKKNPLNDRYFTKTSILYYLQENNLEFKQEMLEKFSLWCKAIHVSNESYDSTVLADCRNFYRTRIAPVFGVNLGKSTNGFIDSEEDDVFNEEELRHFNTFISSTNDSQNVSINIATIHAVKGETHAATLYMETSFEGKTCSQYLLDQLLGRPFNPKSPNTVNKAKCLRMAYVAMSRPKWLLVLAAHENTILPHKEALENNGWKVESV